MPDIDIQQDIDLSWVTFAEEDPKEPCMFYECSKDSTYVVTALPCSHEYFFCEEHTSLTKMIFVTYAAVKCMFCEEYVDNCKYEPLKRG